MKGLILLGLLACLFISCSRKVYVFNIDGDRGDKNGVWVTMDSVRKSIRVENYFNKKLNGKSITITSDGTVIIANYKRGKLNGWLVAYRDGKPHRLGKYKKGNQVVRIEPRLF